MVIAPGLDVDTGRPFLNPTEQQENQYDHNDKPEASAGPVTPISAIGP